MRVSQQNSRGLLGLPAGGLAAYPEHTEITEGEDGDENPEGKADSRVAIGVIQVAAGGVQEQDGDDGYEGGGEEGKKAGGESHEQAGEPTHVLDGDAEEVAGAKGSGACRCGMGGRVVGGGSHYQ